MAWRVAESLVMLRSQINAKYPGRSKASDGTIGDAAHATRSSDHNPWVRDKSGMGVVTALDITHDPRVGLDAGALAEVLRAIRDPRIKYIISNRRICSYDRGWAWRPYSGANAHTQHVHISVREVPALFDSVTPWVLNIPKPKEEVKNVASVVSDERDQADSWYKRLVDRWWPTRV